MPAQFHIVLDRRNLIKFRALLTHTNRRIASQSLFFTAERARDAWRVANHAEFHMRRSWIDSGVRARFYPGNPLMVRVGSVDKYMRRHVIGAGEEKTAEGKALIVPVMPVEDQGTHRDIRKMLRKLKRTPTFVRGGAIFRRLGKGHDAPTKLLAVFRRSVKIEPRLDVERIVYGTFQAAYPSVYRRVFDSYLKHGGK